jgi:hypothetical protein
MLHLAYHHHAHHELQCLQQLLAAHGYTMSAAAPLLHPHSASTAAMHVGSVPATAAPVDQLLWTATNVQQLLPRLTQAAAQSLLQMLPDVQQLVQLCSAPPPAAAVQQQCAAAVGILCTSSTNI